MQVNIRPYEPPDREEALALFGDARAIDDPANRFHVAVDDRGRISGSAVWHEPPAGAPEGLAVALVAGQPPGTMYALVQASVEDAIARGHDEGSFTVRDAALLGRLQRDFSIDARPSGWRDGAAVEWSVSVDLRDALRQLRERSAAS